VQVCDDGRRTDLDSLVDVARNAAAQHLVRVPDALPHRGKEIERGVGMLAEEGEEVLPVEHEQRARLACDRARRARTAAEERQLAEHLAGRDPRAPLGRAA
jgi:hypothetical protein